MMICSIPRESQGFYFQWIPIYKMQMMHQTSSYNIVSYL